MEIVSQKSVILPEGTVITLKQITDMLEIRHDKSFTKIDKLSKEPSFGTVSYLDIVYNERGQTTRTIALTKKQAIAAGAKLDDSRLMKVIDIVESQSSEQSLKELQEHKHKIHALLEYSDKMGEVITDHDKRINNLEKNTRLEAWQEKTLQDAKNKKVYELANGNDKLASKLHRNVWREFKKRFHIPRYNELTTGRYEDGLMWLNNVQLHEVV